MPDSGQVSKCGIGFGSAVFVVENGKKYYVSLHNPRPVTHATLYAARYNDMTLCQSVSLSLACRYRFETVERIELVLGSVRFDNLLH